jgi:hypothetical protein
VKTRFEPRAPTTVAVSGTTSSAHRRVNDAVSAACRPSATRASDLGYPVKRGVWTTATAAGDAVVVGGGAGQSLVTVTGYTMASRTWVVTGSMEVRVQPGGGVSEVVQSLDRVMNTSWVPPVAGNVRVVVNGGTWPGGKASGHQVTSCSGLLGRMCGLKSRFMRRQPPRAIRGRAASCGHPRRASLRRPGSAGCSHSGRRACRSPSTT